MFLATLTTNESKSSACSYELQSPPHNAHPVHVRTRKETGDSQLRGRPCRCRSSPFNNPDTTHEQNQSRDDLDERRENIVISCIERAPIPSLDRWNSGMCHLCASAKYVCYERYSCVRSFRGQHRRIQQSLPHQPIRLR